jgi:hypothetical protein
VSALNRKPIFDAAKALGVVFPRSAEGLERVRILDAGIDQAVAELVSVDKAALADVLRGFYGRIAPDQWIAIEAVLDGAPTPAPTPDGLTQIGITSAQFESAARRLGCTVAQIRAVDEVESGSGWYEDVRSNILALDGPGGFIDGPNLPKILFESAHFDRLTGGKYRRSHPNLSTAKWDRTTYVGGQGEWARLHAAMKLDRHAALMSASVGRYQIMGFNHKLAGYATVEAFWDAMKTSETAHLEAFVTFIISSNLGDELRAISTNPETCRPFARGYNGKGYAKNNYHGKIAAALKRWIAKLK